MYPDLSYILHALIGTPVDNWTSIFKTFGMFLVAAILSAAGLLYLELRRKAGEGVFTPEKVNILKGTPASVTEILSNALFGFILGFKGFYAIVNFAEFQADPAGVLLSGKGNWWFGLLGAGLFGLLKFREGQKRKLPEPVASTMEIYPHQRIGDITIIAAVAGVFGSKVFDILEHPKDLINDPLGTILSGSGLAIYGGLIFGFLGVTWYLRRKKIPVVPVLDAVAPALIVAYGIGRLGCHFSGDGDWGIVNTLPPPSWWFFPDWFWSFDYPHNVLKEGIPISDCTGYYCRKLAEPVYPTPLYETIMALGIGGFLWAIRKRLHVPGMLFFIYLILNGVERFFIEKIRVNRHYDLLGIQYTQAEFISVVLFLIGLSGVAYLWWKAMRK